MTAIDHLKTRAGLLLYRQLPEEYRFLDPGEGDEPDDLEAYLHGYGHLLDLIRGTTEQAYADAFSEPIDLVSDTFGNRREIQTWLLPYLAELVGAELLAPDPVDRREELNNAVFWFKTKGTLRNIDSVSDVVSGAETVVVEGWKRVLITPRMALPPFTGPAGQIGDGDPLGAPALPLGTPDMRYSNRAIVDADGANPLYRLTKPQRDGDGIRQDPLVSFWKPRVRDGVPCFAGAYDDTAVRTPDLRNRDYPDVGPHPRRSIIHVRPPCGFFEPGLRTEPLPGGSNPLGLNTENTGSFQEFRPSDVLAAIGQPLDDDEPVPDKIVITGNLTIPEDVLVSFEDILFTGTITVMTNNNAHTRLKLDRCAVAQVNLGLPGDKPMLEATDCLFGEILSASGFAQLVYCTVMGSTHLERIWASDCLFVGDLVDVKCGGEKTCIRYSRLPDLAALAGCTAENSPTNMTDDPNFIRLHFRNGDDCVFRTANFGEPGCGVLDLTTSTSIRQGAEDEGEMGAYHHLFHAAQLRAVKLKLTDFLPLGQEVAIRYDSRLTHPAATLE